MCRKETYQGNSWTVLWNLLDLCVCVRFDEHQYRFAGAAITKEHRLGLKQQKCICSPFWRPEVPSRGVSGLVSPESAVLARGHRFSLSLHMVGPPSCLCPNVLFLEGHWMRAHARGVVLTTSLKSPSPNTVKC